MAGARLGPTTPRSRRRSSALDHAVATGRASYVGISNYSGWQTAQAATWQRAVPGRAPLASTQVEYSLLNRHVEHEVLPAAPGARPRRPALVAAGPRRAHRQVPHRHARRTRARASPHFASFVGAYLDDRVRGRIVEAVARAADGLGWTPLEVALAWVRDRPGVTAPIVGARTAAQLRRRARRRGVHAARRDRRALDDVSAGRASD